MHQADQYIVLVPSALANEMALIASVLAGVSDKIRVAPLAEDPCANLSTVVTWLRSQHGLTQRHADVLHYLLLGRTDLEIALELGIGVTTVKTHVSEIVRRTGRRNRMRLLELVFRHRAS
jgi:DNA-binding NarL/FixJ family response regulator